VSDFKCSAEYTYGSKIQRGERERAGGGKRKTQKTKRRPSKFVLSTY
jgi:hypothetical protein